MNTRALKAASPTASTHAARQSCALNGLYDTCGVGFEFAQVPDVDAGAPSSSAPDAGDGPRVTLPFVDVLNSFCADVVDVSVYVYVRVMICS